MLLLFFLFFFFSYSNGNIDAPALYSAHNFSAKRIQKRRRNTRARNWNRIKFDGEDGTAAMVVSCICVFLRLIYECLRVFPLNAHAVHLFYISFFFVGAFIYYSLASRSIVLFRQNHNYYYFHRESTTTAAEAATWVSEWVSVIIIVFFSKKVLFCVAASAQFPHREHSQRRNRKKVLFSHFYCCFRWAGFRGRWVRWTNKQPNFQSPHNLLVSFEYYVSAGEMSGRWARARLNRERAWPMNFFIQVLCGASTSSLFLQKYNKYWKVFSAVRRQWAWVCECLFPFYFDQWRQPPTTVYEFIIY